MSIVARFLRRRVARLALCVVVLGSGAIVTVPSSASSGSTDFQPYIVTRAGTSGVLYALWQRGSCALQQCVRLERSMNGGRTFASVAVPPVGHIHPAMAGDTPVIAQLAFVNPSVGYAVEAPNSGPVWLSAKYFLTTNGAKSWRQINIAPHVYSFGLAISQHYVYAITADCSQTALCTRYVLRRAVVGTSTWTTVKMPYDITRWDGGNLAVAAFGSDVWLTTQDQTTMPYPPYLATSHNEGRTFTTAVQPDLTSPGVCGIIPASTAVVWADCDGGNMEDNIVYSGDGGTHWVSRSVKGLLTYQGVPAFDPISSHTAYFINSTYPSTLFRVSSETSPPVKVASMPKGHYWHALDFTNARDGVALTQNDAPTSQLWDTNDGGRTWRRLSV
jgi:hypothetical protein